MAVLRDRQEPGQDRSLGIPLNRTRQKAKTCKDASRHRLHLGHLWKCGIQGRSLQRTWNVPAVSCKRIHGVRISNTSRKAMGISKGSDAKTGPGGRRAEATGDTRHYFLDSLGPRIDPDQYIIPCQRIPQVPRDTENQSDNGKKES